MKVLLRKRTLVEPQKVELASSYRLEDRAQGDRSGPRPRLLKHREKAGLPLELQQIRPRDGPSAAPPAPGFRDDLDVGIVDHRPMDVVRMSGGGVVNAPVEVPDEDDVPMFGDEPGDVLKQLGVRGLAIGLVEQIEGKRPASTLWIRG